MASQADVKQPPPRLFNCVFDFADCTSTFGTKNGWKRHVETKHLLVEFWQCPEDGCASINKIFHRKDQFTDHLWRMHAPESLKGRKENRAGWIKDMDELCKAAIRSRCTLPSYMCCPVPACTAEFRGAGAWDQRMEHVARHIESPSSGDVVFGGDKDKTLVDWASRSDVGILVRGKERGWVLGAPRQGALAGLQRQQQQ